MQAQGAEPLTKVQRTVEILSVLNQHNAFGLLRELNESTSSADEGSAAALRPEIPEHIPPKLREVLQDLGPTFIKMGQLLGTRPDLVPRPFCDEFQKMYDRAPADDPETVKATVEAELGRPLDELFTSFDPEPIASASVGQVHVATLQSGEQVAVKVQHPANEARVQLDFQIFKPIVHFIERMFAASQVWQPTDHLQELGDMLARELDYTIEARNLQRARELFRDDPSVRIPKVYWDLSSKRVLTLEYIEGLKLEEVENANLPRESRTELAEAITSAMGRQIFEHRFFHADPSPGNILIVDTRTVAFLDWGAVGIVSRRRSERILQLIVALLRDDLDMLAQTLLDLCRQVGPTDPVALKRDLEKVMAYHTETRASPANPEMMDLIVDIGRKHNLLLPPDFVLITRSLFQFEGMCRRLDPDYELVEVLGPLIQDVLMKRYTSVPRQKEAAVDFAMQSMEFMKVLPSRASNLLRKVEQDQLTMRMELPGLEQHHRHGRNQVVRLTAGLYGTALILGIALLMALGAGGLLPQFFFLTTLVVIVWALVLLFITDN